MEEVDNIILLTLKQLGTNVEGEVTLKDIPTEVFVEGCARCVNTINGDDALPLKMPRGMSAQFRCGTSLAEACKALGYPEDIGYNTFLYSNETDSRRLLMWLVERLPKEAADESSEVLDPTALLRRAVSSEVRRRLGYFWTPQSTKDGSVSWRGADNSEWHLEGARELHHFHSVTATLPVGAGDATANVSKESKRYFEKFLAPVTSQPPSYRDVNSSLLEANAREYTAAQEWENEWNSFGLASGLSADEYRAKKRQRIRQRMGDKLKLALVRSEDTSRADSDMLTFLAGFEDTGRGESTSFQNREKLQFANEDDATSTQEVPRAATEEELRAQREAEIAELEAELEQLAHGIASMESEVKDFNSNISKLSSQSAEQTAANSEREDAYRVRKQVLDLLPDADENIAKLESVVDASGKRLLTLAAKWEEHRTKLIAEYRKLKALEATAQDETQQQLGVIKRLREEMKQVAEATKAKEALLNRLVAEYEKLNKDVQRSAYTRRTLEIVRSISKQKADIDKVLVDTRALQKDINQLSDKLSRTFTVTDELIFKDAKKDEACRKAYKFLAQLHEGCGLLVHTVEQTGSIMREIRDLEEQIETETHKNMGENLKRLSKDFKTIKKENTSLIAQIKGGSS
eukprot:m.321060 g.321060  ORF g.321060 m.321060 type:complete len:633 (-) comp19707_c1_seq1:73-1971(-)